MPAEPDYAFEQVDFQNPSRLFRWQYTVFGRLVGFLFHRKVVKRLDLQGTERVLDFGCGGGIAGRYLAKKLREGGHVTCLDISKPFVEIARKKLRKFSNVDVVQGDVRSVDLPAESYDLVVVLHVLHDIPPPERAPVVSRLAELIAPGARAFVFEPTRVSHGMPVTEIRRHFTRAGLEEGDHEATKKIYSGSFHKPK